MWLAVIPAPRQGIDTLTAKGETSGKTVFNFTDPSI